MDIDEGGIPKVMAEIMSLKIRVTRRNFTQMARLVRSTVWPKAIALHKEDGSVIDLNHVDRSKQTVKIGWQVERNMCNRDMNVFNRQPSLHKHNMLAHKTLVSENNTMQVHPAVTPGYAADFDGDEMTDHYPQTIGARCEARSMMAVGRNLSTPQSGRPIVGILLDSLMGLYLLTGIDMLLTLAQMSYFVSLEQV